MSTGNQTKTIHTVFHGRAQIDAWKAIDFALNKVEDHYDRAEFLRQCQEGDMASIAVEWPDFIEFCNPIVVTVVDPS